MEPTFRITTLIVVILFPTITKIEASASLLHHQRKNNNDALFHQLFEGDMVPAYNQILDTYGPNVTSQLVAEGMFPVRPESNDNVGNDEEQHHNFYLWPNRNNRDGRVEIAYEFDKESSFAKSARQRAMLKEELDDLAKKSGVVRFVHSRTIVPRLVVTQKVLHEDDFPAWSYVGWHGANVQPLFFDSRFLFKSGVHHMFLHALGFWHTNSRFDRDEYVTIEWDNILPEAHLLDFSKRSLDDTLGYPYDYKSIMHFTKDDFSWPEGSTAMLPKNKTFDADDLGPTNPTLGASKGDIIQIRLLYQCQSGPRSYADYVANPCTADCPCWESAMGSCRGNDHACQGGLICSGEDKVVSQCVQPLAVNLLQQVFKPSFQGHGGGGMVFALGGIAILSLVVALWFRHLKRQNYEELSVS